MRFLFFLFTWTHPNLWVNADIFSLILVLAPINNFLSPKVIIVLNPVYSFLIIPVNEASLLTQTVDVAVMYTKGMVSRTRNRRQSHSCFVDLPRQLIYIMRENAFSFQYSFVQFDKKFTCTYINRFDIQDFDHHAVENGNSTIIYRKTSYRLAPVTCGSNCNKYQLDLLQWYVLKDVLFRVHSNALSNANSHIHTGGTKVQHGPTEAGDDACKKSAVKRLISYFLYLFVFMYKRPHTRTPFTTTFYTVY